MDTKDLTEWERAKEKEEFEKKYNEHLRKLEAIKKDSLKFVSLSKLTETNQEIETNRTMGTKEYEAKTNTDENRPKTAAPLILSTSIADVAIEEGEGEMTEMQKAAKEKKYGELTRTEFVWRPHPIVCKRCNVKNPFPE